MNRDNSGNSIELILLGKYPLSVITLYESIYYRGTYQQCRIGLKFSDIRLISEDMVGLSPKA